MTQIIVTLENNADTSLLQRMIENMKGVISTKLRQKKNSSEVTPSVEDKWIESLHEIKDAIDPSVIDMNDERTKYIMSK